MSSPLTTHWKSISSVPSPEDGSTATPGLNPPACLTSVFLQFKFTISWLRKVITVVSLVMISMTLWQIPLCPISSCLPEPGVRDKGWKKPHFIFISIATGQPRMEVFRLPSQERQLLLPFSSLQQMKGVFCAFFRRKRKGANKRSGNGRVMGMARTPALGSLQP